MGSIAATNAVVVSTAVVLKNAAIRRRLGCLEVAGGTGESAGRGFLFIIAPVSWGSAARAVS
ncbi:hypothetical protein FKR81_12900 [Lentzea tibetensis]|uniref:Uncharacterized protein n=1 Tax=Lentzea tibetensis TaxID=2591470 RepID=A0A563EW50_9PSEU|nr:hypothetical protein [Lentzea tibetensis]TWP51758.1 hypothetical protein FKR81_12900 [Lentzea tibetensis]